MRILGIETSCDETSASVVENGTEVESNVIATTKGTFAGTGGVIPEDAARRQVELIIPVIQSAVAYAKRTPHEIDAIAVTKGPGLLGSLLVGTMTARALADLWSIPLIGVHHTLGHLSSPWLGTSDAPRFPVMSMSASGGHTDLWYRESHTRGRLIGRTLDDAAGEAFDKGAQMLGLPYPGGPSIANAALTGNETAFEFPRPLSQEGTLDMSFSGLKTSLKYTLRDLREISETDRADLAASYQFSICRHLVRRLVEATQKHPDVQEIHIVGGVSANSRLRDLIRSSTGIPLRTPLKLEYCTDNAAMIAAAGFFMFEEDHEKSLRTFTTIASLPLTESMSPSLRKTQGAVH